MTNSLAPLEKYKKDIHYCLQCGLCLAECPMFRATRLASLTSRGKMRILAGLLDGEIKVDKRVEEVFNQCLLCEACTKACPSGIPVGEIMATARSVIKAERGLPLTKKFILWAFDDLKRTGNLAKLSKLPAKLVTKEKEDGLKPNSILAKFLPLAELPKFGEKTFLERFAGVHKPQGETKGRIGYYTGCMTNLVYQKTGEAVLDYLLKAGYEVVIPEEQGCCGLPAYVSGDLTKASQQMQHNTKVFNKDNLDFVIADCASCVSMWEEHGQEEKGKIKVQEVMGFLSSKNLLPDKLKGTEELLVGYHAPCHTRGDELSRTAPRSILKNQDNYIALDYEERCCGGGGSFGALNPDLMKKIQKDKIAEIKDKKIDVMVTTCPSCRLYLASGLARDKHQCRVCHPLELL